MWPEASATAVRELRDRITRRPTRHVGVKHVLNEVDTRAARALEQGAPMSRRYTSSSGLTPQPNEAPGDPGHMTSSTGLPQDPTGSHNTRSAAGGTNGPNNGLGQATNSTPLLDNTQSFNSTSAMPYHSINTPVFDFGVSEWNDFLQASESLDPSISLPQGDGMDPYIGFDIPFWLGQDQYQDMLHDRN